MCDAVVESTLAVRLFIPLVTWFFVSLVAATAGLLYTVIRWKRSAPAAAAAGGLGRTSAYTSATEANARADDGSWGVWRTGAELDEDELNIGAGSSTMLVGSAASALERPLESWQISPRELKLGPRIGVGNVGEVYRAVYRGRTVAVKKLLGAWTRDSDMVDRFREEAYLMSTFSHPNVLGFKGAVLDRDAGQACIVMEYCERGTLADLLRSREALPWQRRLRIARDISLGMNYLHAKAGIVNRDLKSTNLLLTRDYEVRISDFGLSRRNTSGPGQAMLTYCGTPAYLAPEVVRQERYTEKADVYSFGIILWELLTREEPYASGAGVGGAAGAGAAGGLALAYAVATQGLRPPIPAYCPAEWAALMTACWAEDPAARPSFDEIQRALAAIIRAFDEQLKQAAHPGSAHAAAAAAAGGAFPMAAPLTLALSCSTPASASARGAGAGVGVGVGVGVGGAAAGVGPLSSIGPLGLHDSGLLGAGMGEPQWLSGPPPSSLLYSSQSQSFALARSHAVAPVVLPSSSAAAYQRSAADPVPVAASAAASALAPAAPLVSLVSGSVDRAPSPPALVPLLPHVSPAVNTSVAAPTGAGPSAVRGGGSSSVLTMVSDPRGGEGGGSSSVLTVHSLGSAAGAGAGLSGEGSNSPQQGVGGLLGRDCAVSSLSASEPEPEHDRDSVAPDADADAHASASGSGSLLGCGTAGSGSGSGPSSSSCSGRSSRASSSPADPSPALSLTDPAPAAASAATGGAGAMPHRSDHHAHAAKGKLAASPLLEVVVAVAGRSREEGKLAHADAVAPAPVLARDGDRASKTQAQGRSLMQLPGRLPVRRSPDPSPVPASDAHPHRSTANSEAASLSAVGGSSSSGGGLPPRGSSPRGAASPAPGSV